MIYTNPSEGITLSIPKGMSSGDVIHDLRGMADHMEQGDVKVMPHPMRVDRKVLARYFDCLPVLIGGLQEIMASPNKEAARIAKKTLKEWDKLRDYRGQKQ